MRRMLTLFLFFLIYAQNAYSQAGSTTFTIETERIQKSSLNEGKFSLVVNVALTYLSGTTKPVFTKTEVENMKMYFLVDNTENDAHIMPWESNPSVGTSPNFQVSLTEDPTEKSDTGTLVTYAVSIQVKELITNKLLELLTDKTSAKIRISYEANEDVATKTLTISDAVPNAAPTEFKAEGVFKGILATWKTTATIPYSDGTSAAPPSIDVFIFDSSKTITVQGKDVISKENVNCTISAATCITCPTASTHINFAEASKNKDLTIKQVSATATSLASVGLTPDKEYTLFAQYRDSLLRSDCSSAIPVVNVSMAEFYGEGDAEQQTLDCFVATAAYGTPFDKHVSLLRWFRNHYLLSSELGRSLVKLYYKYSPPLANYIAQRPILKAMSRTVLAVPVGVASTLHWLNPNGVSYTGMAVIVLIFFGTLLFSACAYLVFNKS